MTKKNKFFAVSASAALVASAIVPVAASAAVDFNDKDQIADYALPFVEYLVENEVMNGKDGNVFDPKGNLTRAEASKMFTVAFGLEAYGDKSFSDVPANEWYTEYVLAAADNEIVRGYEDGTFAPTKQITRGEAAIMIARALGEEVDETEEADLSAFADGADVPAWAAGYLAAAVDKGIIKGSLVGEELFLNWEANISRQDFAVMFQRTGAVDGMYDVIDGSEVSIDEELVVAVEALQTAEVAVAEFELTEENVEELESAIAALESAIEAVEAFESEDETVIAAIDSAYTTIDTAKAAIEALKTLEVEVNEELVAAVEAMDAAVVVVAAVTVVNEENVATVTADVAKLEAAIVAVEAFKSEDKEVITSVDAAKVTVDAAKAAIAKFEVDQKIAAAVEAMNAAEVVVAAVTEVTKENVEEFKANITTLDAAIVAVEAFKVEADVTASAKATADAAKVKVAEFEATPAVKVEAVGVVTATSTTITLEEKPSSDLTVEDLEVTVNGEAVTVTVAKQASDLTGKTYKLTYTTLKGKEGKFVVNGTEKAFDFKAPEYVSTTVLDNKTVVVAFNEKIANGTISNIAIMKDGTNIANSAVLSADGKSVTIKLNTELTLADYKVVLGDSTLSTPTVVTDVATNAIISGAEYGFRPTQAELENVKAPAVQTAKYDTARGVLTIAFDEQVLTLNPAKLSINETALTGSTINVTTASATITLTTAQKEALASATELTLNGLAEALVVGTGSTAIKSAAFTTEIEAVIPAKLTAASFDEHTDVLALTFDQEVEIADLAEITLNNGSASYTITTSTALTGSKQTWELKVNDATTITALNALTDFAGLKVLLGEGAVEVDGIENVEVAYANAVAVNYTADTVLPTLVSASYNNATNKVTVKASEKIATGSVTIVAQNNEAGTGAVTLTFTADGTDTLTTAALTSTDLTNFEALFSKDVTLTYAANAFADLNDNNAVKLEFANGISVAYNDFVRPTVAAQPVALSAKKVQVVFGEKVSKATAEAVANYKVLAVDGKTSVAVTSAELLTDGVTVVLTLASDLVEGANHAIEIKNVEDVAGNVLETKNDTVVGIASVKAPLTATATTAAVKGAKDTITVAYDEVVNATQALNLSNYYVTVTANGETEEVSLAGAETKLDTDNQTLVITLAENVNLQTAATNVYTVVVTGVTDINGNEFATNTNTLTATNNGDSDAPIFDGTNTANLLDGANNDTVTLYFDEILAADSLTVDAFEISDGSATIVVTDVTGAWDAKTNKYVVTLKTASDFAAVGKTYTVTADDTKVFDLAGNAIDATGSANVATLTIKDRTLPVIVPSTGVVATSVEEAADTIVVEFNKAVVKTTAENKANYVVKDAAGNVIDLTNATIAYNASTKKATITLPDGSDTTKPGVHLQFGKEYSVTAQNVVDTLGNTMATNTVKATVVGDNAVNYTVSSTEGNQDITITFAEAVVLPAGVNAKDLFELSVAGEELSVIVAGKDAAGNIILTISEESTITATNVIDVVLKEGVIILDLAGNKAVDTTSTVAAPSI